MSAPAPSIRYTPFDSIFPVNDLSLGVGLGDGHGLQVLPLGDLGLELCDDGGDVRDVLRLQVSCVLNCQSMVRIS